MIKFFRKMRYDLIEKNKTGKYLKYAIGEIILVVIGILIALQINNWNERRKDLSQEQLILMQLQREYISNLNQLDEKFLPTSLITFCIATSCSGVSSLPLKNPSWFKSYLLSSI